MFYPHNLITQVDYGSMIRAKLDGDKLKRETEEAEEREMRAEEVLSLHRPES